MTRNRGHTKVIVDIAVSGLHVDKAGNSVTVDMDIRERHVGKASNSVIVYLTYQGRSST